MTPSRYFDHAATSFPKAPGVVDAVAAYLRDRAGNPGRGSHPLAVAAAQTMLEARIGLSRLLGHGNPERVVFTASGTEALNLGLFGSLDPGEHVVTTSVEHNAVARPLNRLAANGVEVTRVSCRADGLVDPSALAAACTPATKLVAVTAGSNVLGARTDLAALRPAIGPGPLLVVDAAQTAGARPMAVAEWGLDMVAVPGHKALGGPQGVGALLVGDRVELRPLKEGGTGGRSEAPTTPPVFPDGFEAGTPNGPGIAGLSAAVDAAAARDLMALAAREEAARAALDHALAAIDGIEILSCREPEHALPLVSFRHERVPPGELAHALGRDHGYAVRAGLHCAPDAHRTAGSLESGLVRASLGPEHTPDDAEAFAAAVAEVVAA